MPGLQIQIFNFARWLSLALPTMPLDIHLHSSLQFTMPRHFGLYRGCCLRMLCMYKGSLDCVGISAAKKNKRSHMRWCFFCTSGGASRSDASRPGAGSNFSSNFSMNRPKHMQGLSTDVLTVACQFATPKSNK